MEKPQVPFAQLLNDAITQPGLIGQCYSLFHNYSIGNQLWAWAQMKGRDIPVGPVATFKKWNDLGRTVKKGSKAISMIMPITVEKKDADGNKTGDTFRMFTVRNLWFAVSQTEGDDFSQEAVTPEWNAAAAFDKLNITEEAFSMMDGNCQGYARERTIAVNPIAQFPHKTRFHEIAHVVLGHTAESDCSDDERTPRDIREVEAESTAYILCSILNLPGLEESRGYIQHWMQNGEISDKSAQRIFNAANKILEAGKAKAEA